MSPWLPVQFAVLLLLLGIMALFVHLSNTYHIERKPLSQRQHAFDKWFYDNRALIVVVILITGVLMTIIVTFLEENIDALLY